MHSRAWAPRPWLPRAPPAGDPLAHSSFYPLLGPSSKRQFCAVSDLPSFQFYYLCMRCLSDFSTEETNIYLCEARPPIRPAETPSPTPQGSRLLLQQPCDLAGWGADGGGNAKTAIPATDRKGSSRRAGHPCTSSPCVHSFTGRSGRCAVGDAVFLIFGEDVQAQDG